MDWLGKYPEDPTQTFLGENSTLSVLGQEVGHRWLAFLEFRDHTGARSEALLGRDQAHWSFFFDSDASVMEGNDIEDLGGGSFRTDGRRAALQPARSVRDGAASRERGAAVLLRREPGRTSSGGRGRASRRRGSGVTFNGTRRDVLIQDVIAIHGPRAAVVAESPRVHRQAFIFVVGAGRTADSAQIAKIDRIRRAWESVLPAGHRAAGCRR